MWNLKSCCHTPEVDRTDGKLKMSSIDRKKAMRLGTVPLTVCRAPLKGSC